MQDIYRSMPSGPITAWSSGTANTCGPGSCGVLGVGLAPSDVGLRGVDKPPTLIVIEFCKLHHDFNVAMFFCTPSHFVTPLQMPPRERAAEVRARRLLNDQQRGCTPDDPDPDAPAPVVAVQKTHGKPSEGDRG